MINAVLRLRRDNDYNYAKIKDTFIPMNGEICLVDTADAGLRAVCGDGRTPFGELKYLNDLIKRGYYKDNVFYSDNAYQNILPAQMTNLYIDLVFHRIYYFDGVNYQIVETGIDVANESIAGIMKLYQTTGYNVDGTMSQKAITDELDNINDELDDKIEISLKEEEELLIFSF